MKSKSPTLFLFFFLVSACALFLEASNKDNGGLKLEEPYVKRSDFPSGFLFGAATSAYQVEGAYLEDGKSLTNVDVECHSSTDGENGDVADDHYHLFLKNVEMMHSLGIKAYRFSISWARILPNLVPVVCQNGQVQSLYFIISIDSPCGGRFAEVNLGGILFYNKLIDNLILKGIEPFATLFHFVYPWELEEKYGSWLNSEMQEEFIHLSEICFKSFGDRVKHWVTLNEPNSYAELAYEKGIVPPSHCSETFGNCVAGNSDLEPLIVSHNMLLAHGKVAKAISSKIPVQPKQGGLIGITVNCFMYETLTPCELDIKASKRAFAFGGGWSLDPTILGDYPIEMREYLGSQLQSFSPDEKKFMKNNIDFIGVNHYSTNYVKDCTNSSCSPTANRAIRGFVDILGERDGAPIGGITGVEGNYVVPRGLEEIVNLLKSRYDNKPMFITENGYSSPDLQEERVNVLLQDVKRVEFHKTYLASLAKSIRGGADVCGYFVWLLMHSFEWKDGYKVKFGMYYVDRQTLNRIPKLSAKWYKNFLSNKSDAALRDKRSFLKDFSMLKIADA